VISGLFLFCFNIIVVNNTGVTIGARDILSDQKLKETVKSFRLVCYFALSFEEMSNNPLLCKVFLSYQKWSLNL
jgi:hypothetical protein